VAPAMGRPAATGPSGSGTRLRGAQRPLRPSRLARRQPCTAGVPRRPVR
jgi:hypothetical protein